LLLSISWLLILD